MCLEAYPLIFPIQDDVMWGFNCNNRPTSAIMYWGEVGTKWKKTRTFLCLHNYK